MPEPFAERLSRLTPDGAGLDRDALLFAAGRASARPNRLWQALAAALAVGQVVTLVLLWPRPPDAPPPPAVAPTPAPAVEPPPATPEPPRSWAFGPRLANEPGDLPPPAASGVLVPDDPPLRAFSAPNALLN